MFISYLKTAIRNLSRHRFFSFITIFGLAVSMSISMGIIMLIADQLMYDRYNRKRDRIYRINSLPIGKDGEVRDEAATTTLPLRQELIENYTGVEKAVRIVRGFANNWIEFEQDVNIPVSGYFADPEVLDVFEYELEYGDAKTALVEPHTVVLTKRAARKLFKQENPVGELLKVGENGLFKVTGVIRDSGHKSHIAVDALASLSTLKSLKSQNLRENSLDNWYDYNSGWVCVLLEEGKTPADLNPLLKKIEEDHFARIVNPDTQSRIGYTLQSLTKITPGPFVDNTIGPFMPWVFVYFFAGLAGIVMLTSCFNFTNLSIARSLARAREIGVRKVTGAMRWQIFIQFLFESILVALLSLVAAFGLLYAVKPLMMELSFARMLNWDLEANAYVYGLFFLFALFTGILAGTFPAVVMSGFQPVKALKSLSTMKLFSNMGIRKALLVTQFSFSLVFILTVIIVFSQLRMFMNADHGFTMDHKIILQLGGTSPDALKNALLQSNAIESISAASHIPAAGISYGTGYKRSLGEKDWTLVDYFSVDEDYLKNIDVPLVAGRFFSSADGASNKNFIVLTEHAVQSFHFESPVDAVGQTVILREDSTVKVIVGVVRNYNHQMLMESPDPMVLVCNPKEYHLLQIKYNGSIENIGHTVANAWAKINPTLKVDYRDFSEEVHKFYDIFFGDLVDILGVIAILAIIISCLGLLGMATYTTESRIREVSIRKILGCSDGAIVYLLSKGFVAVLFLAIAIAVPAAYVLNNLWLEKLAYHVTVSAPMILAGVVILILFGALTIGSQTWRAAFVNPVENLRGE